MSTSADAVSYQSVPGKPALLLGAFEIGDVGYVAQEFFVAGLATSYQAAGELASDGRWDVEPAAVADYTTRIVALTPADQARFNGTVLVEWLNVSGGIDAPAVWMMAHREMLRDGYAYIAVSAQRVGIEGGDSLIGVPMSLKHTDSQRYSPLHHPGDAYAYDIFAQAGRLARQPDVLRGLRAERAIALGESQSAMFLTTYINAVDPHGAVYDGFLVHSRFGPAAPLNGDSVFEVLDGGSTPAVAFRPDVAAPLLTVITETDLLSGRRPGYYDARQPDSQQLRVWEIAGAAHADNYTVNVAAIDSGSASVADLAAGFAPTNLLIGQELDHCINFAPQHHYVLQAALARLNEWVSAGEPPPHGTPIEFDGGQPVLDAHGLVRGGVRTPWIDVPVARTSGLGGDQTELSPIFGCGELFDIATIQRLFPGGLPEYLQRFTASLDATIEAGFLLAADRPEILALAEATFPG